MLLNQPEARWVLLMSNNWSVPQYGQKKSINTHHYKCTQKKLHNSASITVGPFTERKHMCGQESKIEVVFWNSSKGLGKQKLILYHMLTIDRSNAVIYYSIFIWGGKKSKRKLDMPLAKQKWWILSVKKSEQRISWGEKRALWLMFLISYRPRHV